LTYNFINTPERRKIMAKEEKSEEKTFWNMPLDKLREANPELHKQVKVAIFDFNSAYTVFQNMNARDMRKEYKNAMSTIEKPMTDIFQDLRTHQNSLTPFDIKQKLNTFITKTYEPAKKKLPHDTGPEVPSKALDDPLDKIDNVFSKINDDLEMTKSKYTAQQATIALLKEQEAQKMNTREKGERGKGRGRRKRASSFDSGRESFGQGAPETAAAAAPQKTRPCGLIRKAFGCFEHLNPMKSRRSRDGIKSGPR
jgi:hypothetical protein